MSFRLLIACCAAAVLLLTSLPQLVLADHIRDAQEAAVNTRKAAWGRWGPEPGNYAGWTSHTNRLIPIYSFGMNLDAVRGERSVYRSPERLKSLYGRVPDETFNPDAQYFDQTDVHVLQKRAVESGKKRVILVVYDGMDWQTTWAAAIHRSGSVSYRSGRGTGLRIQDYRKTETDFGFFVSSPYSSDAEKDVDAQTAKAGTKFGGYSARIGGSFPWSSPIDPLYPIGKSTEIPHVYTGSASAATSMTSGIKTYNGAVNVDREGKHVVPIARQLQQDGWAIGVVTSVPISHATPACAYANNVSRNDFQDLTRDLLGIKTDHRSERLPGVDVLLGTGWGLNKDKDANQGKNFVPGNRYLTDTDLKQIDSNNGGDRVVAVRTAGMNGAELLRKSAASAVASEKKLFGFFGVVPKGNLPFQTADGNFDPTISIDSGDREKSIAAEQYSDADLLENPTLADMTGAALDVLSKKSDRFWLMIEAGDVDWANHIDNIDNSIGAVLSGDQAFEVLTEWIEKNGGWDETVVLLTADHGHYLVLERPHLLLSE